MKRIIPFLIFLISFNSQAVFEVSGNFGYDKNVYGDQRQNKQTDRTYSASFAVYLLAYTAVEFSYSESEQITSENNESQIAGSGFSIVSLENTVKNTIYSVSIKQAFARRKARFRPALSLGYAKFEILDKTSYVFRDDSDGSTFTSTESPTRSREDSFYVNFSLQIRLTRALSLQGSVQSVMPGFEFDQARDNLRYLAGFSWFF